MVTKLSLCAQFPWTGLDHQLVSINEDTGQICKWHASKSKALQCYGATMANLVPEGHVASSSLISCPTSRVP